MNKFWMNKNWIVGILVVLPLVIGVLYVMGIYNKEVSLSTRLDAQKNVVATSLDKMRKVLINQHKVSREFANDFIAAVTAQQEGRSGGSLIKSNTESAIAGITVPCNIENYTRLFSGSGTESSTPSRS